jgi:hypothetical protein
MINYSLADFGITYALLISIALFLLAPIKSTTHEWFVLRWLGGALGVVAAVSLLANGGHASLFDSAELYQVNFLLFLGACVLAYGTSLGLTAAKAHG